MMKNPCINKTKMQKNFMKTMNLKIKKNTKSFVSDNKKNYQNMRKLNQLKILAFRRKFKIEQNNP